MADFDATRSIMGETDIVERLRNLCNRNVLDTGIQREAANEIERLRAELKRVEADYAAAKANELTAEAERDALLADAERFRLWATDPYRIFQAAWKAWNAFGDWREAFDSATGASSGNHDRHR